MYPTFDDDDDFPRTHRGGHGPHGGYGPGGRGPWDGFGGGDPFGLAETLRKLTGGSGHRPGRRANRGDIRQAVLSLLLEEPMHGYQVIRELEERSGGTWKPSAGSVYPTLQLLADEGLIEANEEGGKKVYALTDTGRAEAEEQADRDKPWDEAAGRGFGRGFSMELGKEMGKLGQASAQIMQSGSQEQSQKAAQVLADARKNLYRLLAED